MSNKILFYTKSKLILLKRYIFDRIKPKK